MTAVELSEDDARLILNALSSYRWVLAARTGGKDDQRITDLSARIIWRKGDDQCRESSLVAWGTHLISEQERDE